jgi:SAM-dependent methyltransferase
LGEQRWKVVTVELCKELFGSYPARILDFGSGRGELLELLSASGFSPVGIDADPKCVDLSSRFSESYFYTDLSFVDKFVPRSFDLVVVLHVLEHLHDPVKYVEALKLLTKKYMILGVPNLATMTGMQFFRLRSVNEGHLQGWDFNHFRIFAELHCGLKLIQWKPDYVIVPRASQLLHKIGLRTVVEEQLLPRLMPYQSNSIIGLFEKVDS